MKSILPILPLVILAGMGGLARAQVGFVGGAVPAAGQPAPTAAQPARVASAASTNPYAPAQSSPSQRGAAVAPAERARQTLAEAVAALERWHSVAARVRAEVRLFEQHLVGSGTYVQGSARDRAWRWELRVQTDDGASSLLQVCDGKQFWTYRQTASAARLEWIDAPRVYASLAKHRPLPGAASAGTAAMPTLGLGVGGLPRLLRALDDCCEFRAVNEGSLERMPVWILQGTWRPAILAHLLPEQREAIEQGRGADLKRLPAHVPDRVSLFLGRDDLFPYRLEYHRDQPGEKEWEAGARRSHPPSIVKLEWFEVRFNVPLARDQFYYNPGATKYDDVTGRYLEGLGLPLD